MGRRPRQSPLDSLAEERAGRLGRPRQPELQAWRTREEKAVQNPR